MIPPISAKTLMRRERLRRVVILCCNFTRNLAFYRVGWSERGQPFLSGTHPQAAFWRQANGNFLDICVLEWCKLFGDRKAEHYWGQIVSDAASFESGLLQHLGMDERAFRNEIDAIRVYRNKFVAHLDPLKAMDIPVLDAAQASLRFYHGHIVAHEAKAGDLTGLPDTADKLAWGYNQCLEEANVAFLKSG